MVNLRLLLLSFIMGSSAWGQTDEPPPQAAPPPPTAEAAEAAMPPVPNMTGTEDPNMAQAAPVETLNPAQNFLEPYIFDTREGRRNPFRPVVLKDEESQIVSGPATPLERYEIDELKLIAIMWDVKNPRAMVMDPNKEIHVIGKDERIGRRRGYVATIREGELVVVETTEFNGETVYSTRVMRIEK